jgi:hypothetical protein
MNDSTCIPLYRLFCFFQHNSSAGMVSRIFTPMFTLLVYLFIVAVPGVAFYFVGQLYDVFTYPDPDDHTPELWIDMGFWIAVPALLLFYAIRAMFECCCVRCCMPSLSE